MRLPVAIVPCIPPTVAEALPLILASGISYSLLVDCPATRPVTPKLYVVIYGAGCRTAISTTPPMVRAITGARKAAEDAPGPTASTAVGAL